MLYMLRPCRLTAATVKHSSSFIVLTRFAHNSHTRPCKATANQLHTAVRLPVQASSGSETVSHSDHAGMSNWPCDPAAQDQARKFVRDAASKGGKIVLAPDRDADGLCAGNSLLESCHLSLTTSYTSLWLACTVHTVEVAQKTQYPHQDVYIPTPFNSFTVQTKG